MTTKRGTSASILITVLLVATLFGWTAGASGLNVNYDNQNKTSEATGNVTQNSLSGIRLQSDSSTRIEIIDESPDRTTDLELGEEYTFEFTVDYDTGDVESGYFSVSVREESYGDVDKYVSFNENSGSVDITITETVEDDWEQVTLDINMYDEDPRESDVAEAIGGDEIVYETEEGPPPSYEIVDVDPTDVVVTQGEEVAISATVQNTGGQTGSKTVTYISSFLDNPLEERVTLDPDEQTTVDFSIDTTDADPGGYAIQVYTPSDKRIYPDNFEIKEPATFEIERMEPRDVELTKGDKFEITTTIQNTGNQEETKSVEYDTTIPNINQQSESITLESGEKKTISFDPIDTSDVEPDNYAHAVITPDELREGNVEIEPADPAVFKIQKIDPRDIELTQGNDFSISTTIRNTGGQEATKTIDYATTIQGVSHQEEELSLAPGEEKTIEFDPIDTSDADPGEHKHGVFTPDGEMEGNIYIEETEPATFEIESVEPHNSKLEREGEIVALQGDKFGISVKLKNTGDREATKLVEYSPTSLGIDEQEKQVSLDSGKEKTIKFEPIETSNVDPGKYQIQLSTPDETARLPVYIERVPAPSLNDIVRPEQGEYESKENYNFLVKYSQKTSAPVTARMIVDGREAAYEHAEQSGSEISLSNSFSPGTHTVQIKLENQAGKSTSEEFIIDVSGQGPVIESHTPTRLDQYTDTGDEIEFSVRYSNSGTQKTDVAWIVDNSTVAKDQQKIKYQFTESGTTRIQALIQDSDGQEASRVWKVNADNFEVSPRIADHKTSETISVNGASEIITVSVNHPAENQRDVRFELRAEIPDGFGIVGTDDFDETDAAQAVISRTLEPGQKQNMALRLQTQDDSLVGQERKIEYEIIYSPTDAPREVIQLKKDSIEFTVTSDNNGSGPVEDSDSTGSADTESKSTDNSIPGFSFTSIIVVLILTLLLYRYVRG